MRIPTLIALLIASSQLSACVVHRSYANGTPDSRYNYRYQSASSNVERAPYQDNYDTTRAYPNLPPQTYPDRADRSYSDSYQSQRPYLDERNNSEMAQIIDIREIRREDAHTGGGALVGAIIGGFVGGLIGNQIAKGDDHSEHRGRGNPYSYGRNYRNHDDDGAGRAAATVGGALIGGMIGNEIERDSEHGSRSRIETEITFQTSSGRNIRIRTNNPGQLRIGDQVHVRNQQGRWVLD